MAGGRRSGAPPAVTLSSDFGEHYPAAMRGVLAARGIDRIHDVTHALPAHDVRASAFWLRTLLPAFPPAVHCVVVDPGVGSARRALAVRAGGHALVGPDNGVLLPPARALADGRVEAFVLEHAPPRSDTFHGRDVFAPFAAAIAHLGVDAIETLPTAARTGTYVDLALPGATVDADGVATEIVAVDRFGTAITGCPGHHLRDRIGEEVVVAGRSVPVVRTYGAVARGEALLTVGSHGYVELAVNQGRGVDAFDVAPGDPVEIGWARPTRRR